MKVIVLKTKEGKKSLPGTLGVLQVEGDERFKGKAKDRFFAGWVTNDNGWKPVRGETFSNREKAMDYLR